MQLYDFPTFSDRSRQLNHGVMLDAWERAEGDS